MLHKYSSPDSRTYGQGVAVCPVCTGTVHTFIRTVYDDRYGCPDMFSLVRCNVCGHLMTFPPLAEEELAKLYSTYYPRKAVNVEDLKREAARLIQPGSRLRCWLEGTTNQGQYTVRPGEVMLDVGCGSCLSLLEAQVLGAHAYGIEADPNVRRIVDELKLRVHIGSLHDRPFPGVNFDLIVLNQVIEHIPDPGKALVALKERLKPTGRIFLSFPNRSSLWLRLFGPKWINWHIPYHLHHFNAEGFRTFAQRHGYRVIRMKTITPTVWTILQFRASLITAVRGEPSPIWTVSAIPVQSQAVAPPIRPAVGRVLRGIARRTALVGLMFLLALVNRLVDALGWGDSVVVEIVPAEMR